MFSEIMGAYTYTERGEDRHEAHSASEIVQSLIAHRQALAAAFEVTDSPGVITYMPRGYAVSLDEIKSHEDLLNWSLHLMEKNWVDRIILREFIRLVNQAKGWTLHV